MDTRTPRTPTGDRSSGFDDAPALSMVKVPSDPAQVIVNHASFRVLLGTAPRTSPPLGARSVSAAQDTARVPAAARRAPVVWSGRSAPDDTGATRLLQAARATAVRGHAEEAGSTQVIPRVDLGGDGRAPHGAPGHGGYDPYDDTTAEIPVVRGPETRLLPQMRSAGSAYEEPETADGGPVPYAREPFEDDGRYDGHDGEGAEGDEEADGASARRHGADPVRHAYYPGRRMNLGVVLFPLRVFLGAISIYAGMGKLCDPVYFDGGERGSMVKWLDSLHPWAVAEPLRDLALQHPVGAGLLIAFFQVVVGVLTVLGLWQRVAAVIGALLSAALLVTVSWKTVPVYDAPDIIYLAAWSPLIIAGAPVYSVDGRLAGEAWRTLGPRAGIWELRRRVLRRGALVAALVVGVTLLVGSILGGAVRDADRVVVPGPGEAPRNELPGSPLPQAPGEQRRHDPSASGAPTQGQSGTTISPSGAASEPGATRDANTAGAGSPSQTQGSAGQVPQQSAPPQAPSTTAGPSSAGGGANGTGAADDAGTAPGDGGGNGGGNGNGGGSGSGGSQRLVGGLLGG
ncbi:DoxX family membrane protein [Streptomyces minutiscleroticus]|uniref:DoxX family membrane protein n=1 Tax=Streptomyces minutiscleroticus TaxID=68238 RepID=UPI00167D8DA3|nr:DoxX family membrane protein [Streptomyces minutiscleroticus]